MEMKKVEIINYKGGFLINFWKTYPNPDKDIPNDAVIVGDLEEAAREVKNFMEM